MNMYEFFSTSHPDAIVVCPNCGGDHYEDNHFDEALLREAAKEADWLRFEGRNDQARKVLTALSGIRIATTVEISGDGDKSSGDPLNRWQRPDESIQRFTGLEPCRDMAAREIQTPDHGIDL